MIEPLTVIAVIGVLAAILIPTVGKARETARNAQCISNLRSIHRAAMLWIGDNKNRMPDIVYWQDRDTPSAKTRYQISPYLDLARPSSNSELSREKDTPFKCNVAHQLTPSDSHWGRTYSINAWACSSSEGTQRSEADGYPRSLNKIVQPSKMAFFMDGAPYRPADASSGYWSNVKEGHVQPPRDPNKLQYPHGRSLNVVFVDGHLRKISEAEMIALSTEPSFWRVNPAP